MRQYKLGGGATTTITYGSFVFTSGLCIIPDSWVDAMERTLVRYKGVVRDTAGEAGGGWDGGDPADGVWGSTVVAEGREQELQAMTLAEVIAEGVQYKLGFGNKQRIINWILGVEFPGVFYPPDSNTFNEDNVASLEGFGLTISTQAGGSPTDGAVFPTQPVIHVLGRNGIIDLAFAGYVNVAKKTGTGTLVGTTRVLAVAGVAMFAGLYLSNAQAGSTNTLEYSTDSGDVTVVGSSLVVGVAVASKLALASPLMSATGNDGVAFAVQPKIVIQDALGRTMTALTSNVVASLHSGAGTLEGTKTVAATAGVALFTDLYHENSLLGDTIVLRFTTATLATVDSAACVVGAAIATKLAITTQATGAVTGNVFSPQPVVAIQDVRSRTMTGLTSTITTTLTTGAGVVGGTEAAGKAAVAGVVTFTNLKITESGGGTDKLTFACAGLTSVISDNIVTAAS